MLQTKCAKPQIFWQICCPHPLKKRTFWRFCLFWSLAIAIFETWKNNYRKKCDKRNVPNLIFFAKMLMVPSQIKNVLTFLLFWSLAIAILEAWKTITEKRVTDKTCQSPRFLAKLLPAPSQRKNVLAILVDLKFRDGHIRNKKILQKKMWQTKCSKPIFCQSCCWYPPKWRMFWGFWLFWSLTMAILETWKRITEKKLTNKMRYR